MANEVQFILSGMRADDVIKYADFVVSGKYYSMHICTASRSVLLCFLSPQHETTGFSDLLWLGRERVADDRQCGH